MKVVVFSGTGCSSCVSLKERLKGEFIPFEEKDVLKNMQEVRSLNIRGVPTTVVYRHDDAVIGVVVGNKLDEIKELLKDAE
jgi:glutaredoxin